MSAPIRAILRFFQTRCQLLHLEIKQKGLHMSTVKMLVSIFLVLTKLAVII